MNNAVWELLVQWIHEYDQLMSDAIHTNGPTLGALQSVNVHQVVLQYRLWFEDPTNHASLEQFKNPLEYWKEEFLKPFTYIFKNVVLCLFSIIATSAPSERMFSECSHVVSKVHCQIMPELLDAIIVIKGYLKNQDILPFDDLVQHIAME